MRTTAGGASGSVRNLRIREDTAKYLLNLDANSAHYDPKSRSMREDPLPFKDASQKAFQGDNFVRRSGDYYDMEALAVHSFSAHDKGQDIHMQAAPSQVRPSHTSPPFPHCLRVGSFPVASQYSVPPHGQGLRC